MYREGSSEGKRDKKFSNVLVLSKSSKFLFVFPRKIVLGFYGIIFMSLKIFNNRVEKVKRIFSQKIPNFL
jgi:hypothetical protein